MAATWKWYGKGLQHLLSGDIDFDANTFKVSLHTSTYTPNQDTDEFRTAATNEVGASGTYSAGGLTLGACTVAYDGASNEARLTWADVSATGATITARTAVIYKVVGSAATDILIAFATETGDVTSTAGTFTVDLPAPTLKITAAA